jgi:hypothetical protein
MIYRIMTSLVLLQSRPKHVRSKMFKILFFLFETRNFSMLQKKISCRVFLKSKFQILPDPYFRKYLLNIIQALVSSMQIQVIIKAKKLHTYSFE